jgi:hypothetical protein
VAIAWVSIYPILMVKMANEALSELGITWRILFRQLSSSIAATGSMAIVLLVLGWSLSAMSPDFAIFRLALMIITAAIVYTSSLFLMDGAMWEELHQVYGWVAGRGIHIKRSEVAV